MYLSVGSNLGQRLQNLRRAVRELSPWLVAIRVSSVYETRPMYVTDQPPFLNIAVSGRTDLSAGSLLSQCLRIEELMGRRRADHAAKGPRIIDLDILLYGETLLRTPELSIPHPRMTERQFVLVPLLELAPGLQDPATGRPYAESLTELEDQGVELFAPWEYTRGVT